jgi:hypothetical protein
MILKQKPAEAGRCDSSPVDHGLITADAGQAAPDGLHPSAGEPFEGVDTATITHQDLIEIVIRERAWAPKGQSARNFRSGIGIWCRQNRRIVSDPARLTLDDRFEERLSRVIDALKPSASKGRHSSRNVQWAAVDLKRLFDIARVHGNLPSDFVAALRKLMADRGWVGVGAATRAGEAMHELFGQKGTSKDPILSGRLYGQIISNYLAERTTPYLRNSFTFVRQLEQLFKLEEDTLCRRAFPGTDLIIAANDQPIKYREHQARRIQYEYALVEMPPQFVPVWERIVDWRKTQIVTIAPGVRRDQKKAHWTSDATVSRYEYLMRQYLGYLTLDAPPLDPRTELKLPLPLFKLTEEQRWETGKGIKVEDLTLAHWFDDDLVWGFIEFQRERVHDKKYTNSHIGLPILLNSFLNHDYSFIRANPDLAPLMGQPAMSRAEWNAYIDPLAASMVKLKFDVKRLLKAHPEKSRSADEPLKKIFEDLDPMRYFLELIDRMTKKIPSKRQAHTRALWVRDTAMFQMNVDVPLRKKNWRSLIVGRHLDRNDATGLWHVFVPKHELKNHHSKHAKNISRIYSPETSKVMDQYWNEERKGLYKPDASSLFFLRGKVGQHTKLAPDETDPSLLYGVDPFGPVKLRLEQFFGVGQGTNVFRHLVATSYLKDDPAAEKETAAILNNSVSMIQDNYDHVTQRDLLRTTDSWAAKKRKDFQDEKAKWSPRG